MDKNQGLRLRYPLDYKVALSVHGIACTHLPFEQLRQVVYKLTSQGMTKMRLIFICFGFVHRNVPRIQTVVQIAVVLIQTTLASVHLKEDSISPVTSLYVI